MFIHIYTKLIPYTIDLSNYFIFLAYAFERVIEMKCSTGDEGGTLENTKEKCKNNNDCIGVFQTKCTDAEDSYVCFKNATSPSQVQTEDCFYKKFAIGE